MNKRMEGKPSIVSSGETLEVVISIPENKGFLYADATFTYDSEKLTLTGTSIEDSEFTGVKTVTAFTNGGRAKAVVIDERDGKCNLDTFFDEVQTPDTIADLAVSTVTAISVSPASASVTVGATTTVTATTTPTGAAVVWSSSNTNVATVVNGVVTGVRAGTAVITATAGSYSDSCEITVSAGD